ncbi:non-ribosomal peptide synthetase [Chitinophaga rhizophila]|uniref:Amino acid adenylation domain-containing protein n=1 Tax=Chitinophaga rhizophila TaxID=2866212 RepID=A0ABS7GKA4_9BACT|nr:non-ribosomal peptide synthetase [Chitinophaga rhizophila]MBW8687179.1 amino acid adenylation domain-containing protein [Chitinophaga rhizophila]
METKDLLRELRENDVFISLEGEQLKLKFNQAELPQELVDRIRQHKGSLIEYLKKNAVVAGTVDVIPALTPSAEGYILSAAQQRLWVLHQLGDGLAAYNITHQVALTGDYDLTLFREAVYSVVARHEILRTVFRKNSAGEIRQWVLDMKALDFTIDTILVESDEELQAYLTKDAVATFDLEHGPLLRAALLQTGPDNYVFHYNLHHIIADGWSMGVLANDVMAYYSKARLQPLKIQYKDYAAWHTARLQGAAANAHKQYWMSLLSGELPVTDFPATHPRPSIRIQEGRTMESYLSAALTGQLKAFSRANEGSLFITLLAIWEVLVYRYTGQSDIITGSPVAGRTHTDLENQIGCFVNTVIFRHQVDGRESFAAMYARIKDAALEAYAHQEYPFDRLVDELNPGRSMNRNPIFDIMLVLQNTGKKLETDVQIDSEPIYDRGLQLSKMDLEVAFAEVGDYLSLSINYNTAIYPAALIKRLVQHYKQLAAALIAQPALQIGAVSFISDVEKQQVLHGFNQTAISYNTPGTVVDLFREQVRRVPQSIAVEFEDVRLTYRELDDRSEQLAYYLVSRYAVKPGDLVGIQLYRSEWMIIAILATLKAGAAYVPADPDYPAERLAYISTDSGYRVCIDDALLDQFRATGPAHEKVSVIPGDYAYAIYTSGSTGQPKGVLNYHAGLLNRLLWMRDYLKIDNSSVILQKTPYTFDVSVWELLLPVITGAKLVFALPEGHKDPYYLEQTIRDKQVTIVHFVPSMLKIYLSSADTFAPSALQHIVCSGEALPDATLHACQEKLPVRIHNLYGPTEAAIDVTAIDLTDRELVNIGYPVANTHIYIVNDHQQLQPVGVPGELLIGGVQVAAGYLNKPTLTAEKFISDPFREDGRVYRTGDIASWNTDGSITYFGRRDGQVKIRGNRIELGEVTAALLSHPEIKDAIVRVRNQDLVAYLIGDTGQDAAALRSYLRTKVPDYMTPAAFVQLEAFPLTANGKLDEKALPDPEAKAPSGSTVYVAPRTATEERLIHIFAAELGREPSQIGTHDNYFDLGANSIKLLKIVHEIRQEFGIEIRPLYMFQYTTISDLVSNVFQQMTEVEDEAAVSISEDMDSIIDLMED